MSAVPSSFGKYFLTEKLATGGMAEIYLAKLLGPGGFEKFLIIKKIHPELSGERQFVEMFVAEAKTLVSLSHGNIVPIYELGMVDKSYFIAMEYIDGPTLHELGHKLSMAGSALTPAMAAYVCAELLKGLDYAHRKGLGVIHRDLSPRNVMISREGEVKIVDFGIAIARATETRGATGSGNPAGSYPHMSPEQARGEPLDPRSDVFATGILLWEMLTNRPLFARGDDKATLAAVTDADIAAPSTHCPKAAGILDAICKKALARNLTERYQSAGEFLVAINRYLYSQMDTVTPAGISRFVAKHCPPDTTRVRESRSNSEIAEDRPERSGTVPMERSSTALMERDDSASIPRAKGKPRAETVRSFATHAGFEDVLASATSKPGSTDNDSAETPATDAADRRHADPIDPSQSSVLPEQSPESTLEIPKQSRRGSLWAALVGALFALGVVAVAAQFVSKDKPQARPAIASSPPDARLAPQIVASDAASAAADAGVADARALPPGDDASPTRRRRSDARVELASGSIRVGANPWADVYLDGKKIGRAPNSFVIPAGKHSLELRYKEQSKTISIDVRPSEVTSLGLHSFEVE